MTDPVRIVALSGSLRARSFNTAALRAAVELAPEGVEIRTVGIGELPLFNEDIEHPWPAPVAAFRDQLAWGEAVLFVTPEYNHSIPGGLKNAIDWASRGADAPIVGKTAAVFGAAGGPMGSVRSQYHLRHTAVGLDMHYVNKPEVMISNAAQKFDADLRLTDETARKLIGQLLVNLRDFAIRMRK
jgi:chromate reductase